MYDGQTREVYDKKRIESTCGRHGNIFFMGAAANRKVHAVEKCLSGCGDVYKMRCVNFANSNLYQRSFIQYPCG